MSGTSTSGSGFSASGIAGVGSAIGGVFTDLGQAQAGSITAAGEAAAAQGFGQASNLAYQNYQQTEAAGKLQQIQLARQLYSVGGTAQAETAGQGLKMEGSAANILRNIAQQGAVASQLTATQTAINATAYVGQMQSDAAEMAQATEAEKAAKASSQGGIFGAALNLGKAAVGIAGML